MENGNGTTRRCLSAAEIITSDDLEREWVPTPEWGQDGGCWVRGLSVGECQDMAAIVGRDKSGSSNGAIEHVVRCCVVNEDGTPLFDRKDMAALRKRSWIVMHRIMTTALELSGLGNDEVPGPVSLRYKPEAVEPENPEEPEAPKNE